MLYLLNRRKIELVQQRVKCLMFNPPLYLPFSACLVCLSVPALPHCLSICLSVLIFLFVPALICRCSNFLLDLPQRLPTSPGSPSFRLLPPQFYMISACVPILYDISLIQAFASHVICWTVSDSQSVSPFHPDSVTLCKNIFPNVSRR